MRTNTLHQLILFRKRFITWQNTDTFFSALGLQTEEQIKLAKDKIRFDL